MSERTRHAAELAARLWIAAEETHGKPNFPNFGRLAQDVDKLLRLSASLRGIGERKRNGTMPKCPNCKGFTDQPGGWHCVECDGTGEDTRREKRLIQAITDTLNPYGLTWKHGPGVHILFVDVSGYGWKV